MYTTAEPVGEWLVVVTENNKEETLEHAPSEDSAQARAEHWRHYLPEEFGYTVSVRRQR